MMGFPTAVNPWENPRRLSNSNKAELKKLKEEKEEAKKNCINCCEQKADTVIIPCGHLVCCGDCAEDMELNSHMDPCTSCYG